MPEQLTYSCDKCGYKLGHFGDSSPNRVACLKCNGWMYPTEFQNKRRMMMPTTIFYIALVALTSAPFNFFWLIIAVIVDMIVNSNLYTDDTEW